MPRASRKRSGSGFYHVVIKGDGGQVIFENDTHRLKFLNMLEDAAFAHKQAVHAYCLMSNHVHLLVEDKSCSLSDFMKQVDENYARYFAWCTQRVGHVFQGRFWSEAVETDEYLLSAIRYIHANPEAAGMCRSSAYRWSSYGAYRGSSSFVETEFILSLLGGVEAFERFSASGACAARPFRTSKLNNHLSSDELVRIAQQLLGKDVLPDMRSMKPREREQYLARLLDAGFTKSEIARVTGVGQASISRALKIIKGDCPQP